METALYTPPASLESLPSIQGPIHILVIMLGATSWYQTGNGNFVLGEPDTPYTPDTPCTL